MTVSNRLNQAKAFIDRQPGAKYTVSSVAALTHLSPYHFHRLWKARFGVPLLKYITHARLRRSASQLAYRQHLSITEIAFEAGYESPEAYSRAFSRQYGTSPRTFRQAPDFSITLPPDNTQPQRTTIVSDNYELTLEHRHAVPLAVMRHEGSPTGLPGTIQRFIAWRKANKLPPPRFRTFNLLYDDPRNVAPHAFRFDLCCEVPPHINIADHEEVSFKTLPQGRFACVTVSGSDNNLEPAIEWLYSNWLVNSDYQPADFPLIIERRTFYPDVSGDDVKTDILLALSES